MNIHLHGFVLLAVAGMAARSLHAQDVEILPETAGVVRQLVDQLDSLNPEDRTKAQEKLLDLRENILPLIDQDSDSLSFEAQERLQQVREILKQRETGVVVAADYMKQPYRMRAGVIIYAIDGQPVNSRKQYDELTDALGDDVKVPVHTYRFYADRGKYSEVLTDRRNLRSYMVDATTQSARTFHALALQEFRSKRYEEAYQLFRKAADAGLDLDRTLGSQIACAYTLYHTGHRDLAHQRLDTLLAYLHELDGEYPYRRALHFVQYYFEGLEHSRYSSRFNAVRYRELLASSVHISSYVLEKVRRHDPEYFLKVRPADARHLSQLLRNCPDAIVLWMPHLKQEYREDENAYIEALVNIYHQFQILGLDQEILEIIRYLATQPYLRFSYGTMAEVALSQGDVETAELLHERDTEEFPNDLYPDLTHAKLYRFYSRTNRHEEVQRIIESINPYSLFYHKGFSSLQYAHWSDLQDSWRSAAMAALKNPAISAPSDLGYSDWHVAQQAMSALIAHPDFDGSWLTEDLMTNYYESCNTQYNRKTAQYECDYVRVIAGASGGNYQDMVEFLRTREPPRSKKWDPESDPRDSAYSFLLSHHDDLTGDLAKWSRGHERYVFADGVSLLVTRDFQMALFSEKGEFIREVSAPSLQWGHRRLRLTPDRRTLLAYDPGTPVVGFRLADGEWKPLVIHHCKSVSTTYEETGLLGLIAPVADHLYDYVMRHEPLDVKNVYDSSGDLSHGRKDVLVHVLRDGTYLDIYRDGRIINHNETLKKALGHDITVYNMWPMRRSAWPTHYFTSHGVIFRDEDGNLSQMAIPDRDDHPPVTLMHVVPNQIHFGLLPHVGSECYRLDERRNRISATGFVSESYPITYWLTRSADENRQAVAEAVMRAGYEWPIDWTRRPAGDESAGTPRGE